MLDILQLNDMLVPELRELAEELGVNGYKRLNKQDLIYKILDQQAIAGNKKIQEAPAPKQQIKAQPDSKLNQDSPQESQEPKRFPKFRKDFRDQNRERPRELEQKDRPLDPDNERKTKRRRKREREERQKINRVKLERGRERERQKETEKVQKK